MGELGDASPLLRARERHEAKDAAELLLKARTSGAKELHVLEHPVESYQAAPSPQLRGVVQGGRRRCRCRCRFRCGRCCLLANCSCAGPRTDSRPTPTRAPTGSTQLQSRTHSPSLPPLISLTFHYQALTTQLGRSSRRLASDPRARADGRGVSGAANSLPDADAPLLALGPHCAGLDEPDAAVRLSTRRSGAKPTTKHTDETAQRHPPRRRRCSASTENSCYTMDHTPQHPTNTHANAKVKQQPTCCPRAALRWVGRSRQ